MLDKQEAKRNLLKRHNCLFFNIGGKICYINMKKIMLNKKLIIYRTFKTVTTIPAPSYHEEKRAQFCKQWFEERGIDAKIDKMNNVVIKMFDDNQDIAVFCSHLDVFLMIWSY